MNYNSYFQERVSKLLFLEVSTEKFCRSIGETNLKLDNDILYIPLSIGYISESITKEISMSQIPVYKFIEGMFYVLGADSKFKYNEDYKKILTAIADSEKCIKNAVANAVKNNNLIDGFIYLNGMIKLWQKEEYYEKLFIVGDEIRKRDKDFEEIFLNCIDECKIVFPEFPTLYLYKAICMRDNGEYDSALIEINEYFNKGGECNDFAQEVLSEISDITDYNKGKELILTEPQKALEKLLPLMEKFEQDPLLYYYVGLAYRKIENFEKAIYYLNESLALDSAIVETVNELGINYASIGDFESALKYFRKAFEATRDVEICTNIIMCYINLNKLEEAKLHLDIALKLDENDEIVRKLKEILGKN